MKFRSLREKVLWESTQKSYLLEADNRQKILKIFRVDQEVADKAHEISDKLSIWLVDKAVKMYPNNPLIFFDRERDGLNKLFGKEGLFKIPNTPKTDFKNLSFEDALGLIDVYHYITDWTTNPNVPSVDLTKMTWEEAEQKSQQWHDSLKEKGGGVIENEEGQLIHKFSDGFYFILLPTNYCEKEADSMQHCGKASNPDMYLISLRKNQKPFVTADWHPEKKYIIQLKGKQNDKPEPKYHKYIKWLIGNPELVYELRVDEGIKPETNLQINDLSNQDFKEILASNPNLTFNIEKLHQEKIDLIPQHTMDNYVKKAGIKSRKVNEYILSKVSPEVQQEYYDNYVKKDGEYGYSVPYEILSKASPKAQQEYYVQINNYVKRYGQEGREVSDYILSKVSQEVQQEYYDNYAKKVVINNKKVNEYILSKASPEAQQKYYDNYVKVAGEEGRGIPDKIFSKVSKEVQQEYIIAINNYVKKVIKNGGKVSDDILSKVNKEVQQQYYDNYVKTFGQKGWEVSYNILSKASPAIQQVYKQAMQDLQESKRTQNMRKSMLQIINEEIALFFINKQKKIINENIKQDKALDNMNQLGGFEKLKDIDKLALLSNSNDFNKLKKLSLENIYKDNGGTFGRFEIQVKVKPKNEQPFNHELSKKAENKIGWLYPYINYNSNNNPYVRVRFEDFTHDNNMKGGGIFEETNVMLDNMFPVAISDEMKSQFKKHEQKVDDDRIDFGF